MKGFVNKSRTITFRAAKFLLRPITNDGAMFVNIILLMIVPTLFNVFVFNYQEYVVILDNGGFVIKGGASFPFILFFPYAFSYILCAIALSIKNITNTRWYNIAKVVIYITFTIIYGVEIFLLFNFNTMVSPSMIMLINETTGEESSDFIHQYIFSRASLLAYITIAFTIFLLYISNKKTESISLVFKHKYIQVFLFVFSLYIFQRTYVVVLKNISRLYYCKSAEDVSLWYLSYNPDSNTITNLVYSFYTQYLNKHINVIAITNTLKENETLDAQSKIDIVLVIGESFNKHHSNLYGYNRNTNPSLCKERDNGNLFVFDNVVSPYNLTSLVLKNLFSVNSIMEEEKWYDYPAFPIIFKKAGYNVYFWDNQLTKERGGASDFTIASYIHNSKIEDSSYSQTNKRAYQFDNESIMSFYNSVPVTEKGNLMIFHLKGQHCMAAKRFPHTKQFLVFNTDSIKDNNYESAKRLISEYDNATIYNDFVLTNIINHHRHKEAVVIYFSDHGEEVYDYRDFYGRSHEKMKTKGMLKYQYEIPFMIWCSDSFIRSHPVVTDNIKSALHKPFTNDDVCQILFYLAGINTKYYHASRNLISPEYTPHRYRMIENINNYEKIMNKTFLEETFGSNK